MNQNERTAENGGIFIANDVIASIAINAAKDVDGVSGFASKTPGLVTSAGGKDGALKSVRVLALDNEIKIHIYIRVKSGANIQTVSMAIQRGIKNAVQGMTGKVVSTVNVSVQGIDFDAPTELKANS